MLNGRVIARGVTIIGVALMAASAFTMTVAQGEPTSAPIAREIPSSNPPPVATPVRVILPAPWESREAISTSVTK